jgi:hypothetical protein
MSNNTRRIVRRSFAEQRPPTTLEDVRSRQTGVPVQQLRYEQVRFEAADVLQRLLDEDQEQRDEAKQDMFMKDCFLLSHEQRHALHVAVGTLRKKATG